MADVKYIILCLVLHICYAAALQCDENEIEEECPTFCKSYYCPRSEEESLERKPCEEPSICPEPSCKSACRFNYSRNKNHTCIPTRDCPPFKCSQPNQEYQSCRPLCPTDDCSQATPDGRCPQSLGRILIVLPCKPACHCIKGYWKKNDVCVPYAECGKTDSDSCSDEKTPKNHKSIDESISELSNY